MNHLVRNFLEKITTASTVDAAKAYADAAIAVLDSAGIQTVVIENGGPNKINGIKALRAVTGMGLREAKDVIEMQSKLGPMPGEIANKLARELRSVGVVLRIES